jgi:hypothetical protein
LQNDDWRRVHTQHLDRCYQDNSWVAGKSALRKSTDVVHMVSFGKTKSNACHKMDYNEAPHGAALSDGMGRDQNFAEPGHDIGC